MRAMTVSTIVALLMPACAQRHDDGGVVVETRAATAPTVSSVNQLPGCVSKVGATTWLATFGYESRASRPVVVPVGTQNGFSPTPSGRGQPERFDPGKHVSAFSVPFDGNALTWTLGTAKTTLSSASTTCAPPAGGANPALGAFVLYARTMVRLDRPKIYGGDIGVAQVGQATDGRDELSLEPSTITDRTRRAFAATVDLRAGATLGAVFTNRLDNGGGTTVSVAPFAAAAMPALPTVAPITAGTTAISVAIGQTK